jgi:hypothetical protein
MRDIAKSTLPSLIASKNRVPGDEVFFVNGNDEDSDANGDKKSENGDEPTVEAVRASSLCCTTDDRRLGIDSQSPSLSVSAILTPLIASVLVTLVESDDDGIWKARVVIVEQESRKKEKIMIKSAPLPHRSESERRSSRNDKEAVDILYLMMGQKSLNLLVLALYFSRFTFFA